MISLDLLSFEVYLGDFVACTGHDEKEENDI